MDGLAPKDQAGAWQLISVNINRECSSDISVIAEKLLELVRTRAHLLVIFSIQETRSWDVPNLELPGYVCFGSKFWLATLLVSEQFCKIRRSWRFEERCTAVLFGTTLVMAVYAPDCGNNLGVHETFIFNVTKVLREVRCGGARDFCVAGDPNVELGSLCTDEEDIEELNEMCGPLC